VKHVALLEERSANSILVDKPEGSKSLGRHRSIILKWIFKIYDSIYLAQDISR
jgi:hypothetical protein